MPTLYSTLLVLHIAAGSTALLTGTIATISHKGGQLHRRVGVIYAYAMGIVCATALLMGNLKWNPFLLSIGIFSAYLTVSGLRILSRKKDAPTISFVDKVYLILTTPVALWMLWMGINNIVLGVFGAICLAGVTEDIFSLFGKHRYNFRTFRIVVHLGRMLGSYIAVWTAFSVTNVPRFFGDIGPWWVVWLAPTIIVTPIISFYSRKYIALLNQQTTNHSTTNSTTT